MDANATVVVPPLSTEPQPTFAPVENPTPMPEVTPIVETPANDPTALPPDALLTGIKCERQFMNNCGPATLSMYLSYYDWGKDQLAAGEVLKPNWNDVNVNPYELAGFVNDHTEQNALWRYGGTIETLKALVSAGFPVMIEKGFSPFSLRNEGWMGHYNLVVGYDDKRGSFTVQDSYLMNYPPWGGTIPLDQYDTFLGFDFSYEEMEESWRAFNFVFIVVYPPEKEAEVLDIISPLADEKDACLLAYDRAMAETSSLTDVRDQYFAWFNVGTSGVCLEDYTAAARAFDSAFALYPDIPQDKRPFRILWYQTGPYEAYYHAGRYADIINLASQTIEHMADPVLEESYYWRAMAYNAQGKANKALSDVNKSLEYHAGYAPSLELLKQLQSTP